MQFRWNCKIKQFQIPKIEYEKHCSRVRKENIRTSVCEISHSVFYKKKMCECMLFKSCVTIIVHIKKFYIYIYIYIYMYICQSFHRVSLFMTPWTVAREAPLSMEFSRQEHWSAQPFPSLGDLPDPGIKTKSFELQADSLPSEPRGKPTIVHIKL